MESIDQEMLKEMERLNLEDEKSEELVCPEKFIKEVLGYQLETFHREWLEIQKDNKKSLILAPRGHGKSTICTISYPLWRLLNNPELRILIVSNTSTQACAFLRESRAHLESNPWIRANCKDLAGRPWTENEIALARRRRKSKEASITALGVLGPVISKHYDLIILDDIVDEQNARTQSQREKLMLWYYKVLLPCLEPLAELHIVGTRYHYLDFYGHLIANDFANAHWIYRAIDVGAGLAQPGRALWEEKFPLSLLQQIRKQAGSAIFNSQYQNDIELMKGAIFKPEWIQYYQTPPARLEKIMGIDLAISEKDQADYFAIAVVGLDRKSGKIYVLDTFRDHLSFQSQIQVSLRLFRKHNLHDSPILRVCVEANGYQEAFAQKLRAEGLPVRSVKTIRDKISRAYQLQAKFENAEILFPRHPVHPVDPPTDGQDRQDASDLIQELILFPEADHDDLFDALELAVSQAKTFIKPFPKTLPQVDPE